jgi:hypothetical protein
MGRLFVKAKLFYRFFFKAKSSSWFISAYMYMYTCICIYNYYTGSSISGITPLEEPAAGTAEVGEPTGVCI